MKINNKRTAFILAAGLGSRLKELTSDKPKALVELNGRPLLEIVIENLISQNFNHFVINIHHFGDKIIDYFKTKKYDNINIEISDERELLLDTGGEILKALPYFKDSNAVLLHTIKEITSEIEEMTGDSVSGLGTGGMTTKLNAAKIVTESGTDMVIANGNDPDIIYDIVEGKDIGTRFIAKGKT